MCEVKEPCRDEKREAWVTANGPALLRDWFAVNPWWDLIPSEITKHSKWDRLKNKAWFVWKYRKISCSGNFFYYGPLVKKRWWPLQLIVGLFEKPVVRETVIHDPAAYRGGAHRRSRKFYSNVWY